VAESGVTFQLLGRTGRRTSTAGTLNSCAPKYTTKFCGEATSSTRSH